MKNQWKYLSVLMCGLIVSNYSVSQNSIHNQLQQVLIDTQKKYHISAISLSISLPSLKQIDLTRGKLIKNGSVEINARDLFQVASLTKTFTAALMLQLEEDGKLNIQEPIGKYLPEYSAWKAITIRQLLNQTSGIADYIDSTNWGPVLWADQAKVWKPSELIAIAAKLPPYFSPGKGWHYSNTNYVLAGLIIERVTGHSISDELRKRFFDHAGFDLKDSYYLPMNYPKFILSRMVHGYYSNYDQTLQNTSWLHAAGALISTPHDMVRWDRLMNTGMILKEKQSNEMTDFISTITGQPQNNLDEPAYGLSIFRINTPYGLMWFTPGVSTGYRSILVYLPCNNIVLAYSVSEAHLDGFPFHADILSQIISILLKDKNIKKSIHEYQLSPSYPNYCKKNVASDKFRFPQF